MFMSSGFLFVLSLTLQKQAVVYRWDGKASTSVFPDPLNWNPDGTTFTTADEYQMTDGSSVNAAADFSVGGFDISGEPQLTVAMADVPLSDENEGVREGDSVLFENGKCKQTSVNKRWHLFHFRRLFPCRAGNMPGFPSDRGIIIFPFNKLGFVRNLLF